MKNYNYTFTTEQTGTQGGSVSTENISLTGTNNIIFSLSGIDQAQSTVNKVIFQFPDNTEKTFTRNLTTDFYSLTSITFDKIIETEAQESCSKDIIVSVYRDDGFADYKTLTFSFNATNLEDYGDVNLIKNEYFTTDVKDNNLLLTFNADSPSIAGTNLICIDDLSETLANTFYKTNYTGLSSLSSEISMHSDTIITNAGRSNLKGLVLRNGYNTETISVKYKTRVPTTTAELTYNNDTQVYVPAIPNTTFFHVSGQLIWHANKIDQVKAFTIPLIDTLGAYVSSIENASFYNYFSSALQDVSANYFFVDLYDLSGCDTELCECSTLTAYINY